MKIIKHSDKIYLIPKQYSETTGYSVQGVRVDGKEVARFDDLLPLQFDHVPLIELVKKTSPVDYYKNKAGEIMSAEDHEIKSNELYKADEDGCWESLDDEFAYKKFSQEWSAVYKDVIEYIPILMTLLYGNVKSEFEDILPIYFLTEKVDGELFQWTPDFRQYVMDVAKKYGFVDAGFDVGYNATKGRKYSFSRRENIEYLTVNGSYASALYESSSLRIKTRMGTYEELAKARESAVAMIDSYFAREYQKTNESKINNIGAVVSKLASIGDAVRKIDPKMKSYSEKRFALGQITNLIEELSK